MIKRERQTVSLYPGAAGFVARLVDHAVDVLAPQRAVKRRRARAESAALLNFDAAQRKRTRISRTSDSADQDLLGSGSLAGDLGEMREQARALVRDDSHGAALIEVLEDNVVGTGLRPQSTTRPERTGMTDKQTEQWAADCEGVFGDWADSADAGSDASEHSTFWDLQRQTLRGWLVEGEAFAHRVNVPPDKIFGRELATAIEMIDPDRVETPAQKADRNRNIRGGVEIGPRGQARQYWITPRHPREYRFKRPGQNDPRPVSRFKDRVPNIVHVFRRLRAGQTRGIPKMAASFGLFEHMNDFLDSEVTAARAASKISMWIRQTIDPSTDFSLSTPTSATDVRHESLQSGTIRYLNDGEEMQAFNPNRPGAQFDPFVVRVLRSICASFGLPYEMAVKDFGGMNYSNARVALLESRRGFECAQVMLASQFCRPWWRVAIMEAVARGIIPAPNGFLENPGPFLRTVWVPPSWGWVDPIKEVESSRLAVENNLSTPQIEAARNGIDVQTVLEQKARFLKLAAATEERFELEPGALTATTAGSAQKPQEEPEEPEEEPDDPEQADDPEAAENEPEPANAE